MFIQASPVDPIQGQLTRKAADAVEGCLVSVEAKKHVLFGELGILDAEGVVGRGAHRHLAPSGNPSLVGEDVAAKKADPEMAW